MKSGSAIRAASRAFRASSFASKNSLSVSSMWRSSASARSAALRASFALSLSSSSSVCIRTSASARRAASSASRALALTSSSSWVGAGSASTGPERTEMRASRALCFTTSNPPASAGESPEVYKLIKAFRVSALASSMLAGSGGLMSKANASASMASDFTFAMCGPFGEKSGSPSTPLDPGRLAASSSTALAFAASIASPNKF
mmetsp:Transcript_13373/g.31365  ORF Transcript_13373/g.31365 Transcript_13373/m.31365 type:complete len:203 (-) Transcript_13373:1129-1737(-)